MTHRERLLDAGSRSLSALGYNGTRVDAVLVEADVPKGSFYHHFGTKQSFSLAVIERYWLLENERFQRWSRRADLRVVDRIAGCHGEMIDCFVKSGWRHSDLFGTLSTELAPRNGVFREHLSTGFTVWRSLVVELIVKGQRTNDVRGDISASCLADTLAALIHGAFAAAASLRDRRDLDLAAAGVGDLLAAGG